MELIQQLVLIGFLFVLIGIGLMIAGTFLSKNTEVKSAGVFMIGPIPIVFGDRQLLIPLLILVIVIMILWFLIAKGVFG